MPGLWRHMWRAIIFCLIVDDFGIKVTDMADIHHLKMSLKEYYKVIVDWMGLLFCGVKLTWDYKQCHVDCSMPGTSIPRQRHPKMRPTPRLLSNMAPRSSKVISTPLPHCHPRS